eukprot:SAG22_NODE_344_length_11914_cov_6.665679_3_plen_511_part_00
MGPTATVPFSHYWTFNHETNHDSYATDHLDFNYQLEGLERTDVSGPNSPYSRADIVAQTTVHDKRMREAVTGTGWPLVRQFEAAPLAAGTVVLYSHNLFHRGNHRLDPPECWADRPRFMWRFWLYRTTDPAEAPAPPPTPPSPPGAAAATAAWEQWHTDPLTGVGLDGVGEDVHAVWRYHAAWMRGERVPRTVEDTAAPLAAQLELPGEAAEPARIGAGYRLAALSESALAVDVLLVALQSERESVRRAASYGLCACEPAAAVPALLTVIDHPVKWVRKAACFGLAEVAALRDDVLAALSKRLKEDPSVYVRSVAAVALGCAGKRAAAAGGAAGRCLLPSAVAALLAALDREPNRLAPDRAQGRSIKFVRPTDEADVCEGGGVDFTQDAPGRFEPVRSAVRENVLWSLVILCTHYSKHTSAYGAGALRAEEIAARLASVARTDKNAICVGFAMDALHRLAAGGEAVVAETAEQVLAEAPMRSWESLCRSGVGLDAAKVAALVPEHQITLL